MAVLLSKPKQTPKSRQDCRFAENEKFPFETFRSLVDHYSSKHTDIPTVVIPPNIRVSCHQRESKLPPLARSSKARSTTMQRWQCRSSSHFGRYERYFSDAITKIWRFFRVIKGALQSRFEEIEILDSTESQTQEYRFQILNKQLSKI